MPVDQRDKELTAIGASIGANCRPCIEHHIEAARAAGLSTAELVESVTTAHAVRNRARALLASRIGELLGGHPAPEETVPPVAGSRDQALVALGASVGANSHALLRAQIAAARELGVGPKGLATAIATAEHVQRRAAEITATKATTMLDELHDTALTPPGSPIPVEEVRS